MPVNNPQKIEQPASGAAPTPGIQARVFTMPERYRHGAEWKMHEPIAKQPVTAPVQVNTPTVPAPKAPPKPSVLKKKASTTKKLLIVGVVVLLVLGVGGFLLVYFTPKPAPQTPSTTPSTTTRPTPVVEEEELEPVVEEEPEPEPEVFPTEVTPGTDSDSDGLTDTEENLVYETNPKRPDTDADGFLDGNEVFHGYNPDGTAPGTLIESGLVEAVSGTFNGSTYTFSYPSAWDLEEVDGEMVLDAQTGEGFRVSVEEGALPDGDVRSTKQGLTYVLSEDQLTAYVSLGTSVLKLEYDTGIKSKVDYLQTFQMMLNTIAYDSSASEPVDSQGGTETTNQATSESP